MNSHRKDDVPQLAALIQHGQYRVEASVVADAIIGRLSGMDMALDYASLVSSEGGRHRLRRQTAEPRRVRRSAGEARRGRAAPPPLGLAAS